ncbi:hypothetical protein PCANC_06695 [Puccinia coronata f. sp. avenae]|uniref:Uncharacterized protein n=1 Tax=Puccinia coronata f. sp. avenae TaxID=200324 RepID=A0A2N5VUE5_9BASI|nr:hypothetical protein PCASD_23822 [Puccinia coronata f. sp. avenae]PLW45467.1 hypothetical protein PCASD_05898 [Puccinia coronata f. sp. avenae]PLW53617.1 hypothetical protein PCANC_06695 [Puccinia coronata f. sp. avenae]
MPCATVPHIPDLNDGKLGQHSDDSLDSDRFAADEEFFNFHLQSGESPSRHIDCVASPFGEPEEVSQQKSLKTRLLTHPDPALSLMFIRNLGWDDGIKNHPATLDGKSLDQPDGPALKKHKQQ